MVTSDKIDQFIRLCLLQVRLYIGLSISIFLFLLFFQPFTTDTFEFEDKLLFHAGFGLIVLVLLFVAQIVFQQALVQKIEDRLSTSLYVPLYYLFLISTVCLAFVFYIRHVGQIAITFNIVVRVLIICLSLPVTLVVTFRLRAYQVRLKTLTYDTLAMREKLKQFSESYTNKHIEIVSENESDNFRIQVSEIVYVKSADNYVEIGYHDEGIVKKKMVRNTLRGVELQLDEFNNFIRTHRTSIVNIQYIDKLNKNFNTYWLSLDYTKETIPVSRHYLMAVKDLV